MSPNNRLGVLLVSGRMTHQENYAPAFAAEPRCRLVAVSDERNVPSERAELNRQLAQDVGIPYISDLDAALSRQDVQVVSICTEPERRGAVAVRCAEAGKHVYMDKPMAGSLPAAQAVVCAVQTAGVRSHVFSLITTAWAERAKRILASGQLGDLLALHTDVLFAKGYGGTARLGSPRQEHFPPQRLTFPDAKRELYAMGVYGVGLVRWLIGQEVRTVYGGTANYFFGEHQQNNVEDFGLLMLSFQGGVTATVAAGRIGWRSHPHDSFWGVRMVGTRAAAYVTPHRPRMEVYGEGSAWSPPPSSPKDPMGFWRATQQEAGLKPKTQWLPLVKGVDPQADVKYFVDCIQSGRESEMSAPDGAAAVEILMAGYLSAATREVVSLPLRETGQECVPTR